MSTKIMRKGMDLTEGPVFKNLLVYAIPFIFTNILQLFFHAADVAVVGVFVGDDAVAAVGANGSLTTLFVNLFVALSTGANIVLSKYVGAKNVNMARKTVGTALSLSLISGFILLAIGVPCAGLFLTIMDCDLEIFEAARTYLRIYFLGAPVMMVYNFSASILRATGDTKRPLIFLTIGGVANVVLNVFFVVVCNLSVAGVAIATVISNFISAFLCVLVLVRGKDDYAKLQFKYFRIYKEQLKSILRIGIPTAIQSLAFSLSNVLIQSTVNGFGKVGTSANTAAAQIDGIIYTVGNAVSNSCMSFVGQNVGARKPERIKKGIKSAILLALMLQFSLAVIFLILAPILLGIFLENPDAIEMATTRLAIIGLPYFLCGFMEIFSYSIRAMGKPVSSMIVGILGSVVFRVIWMEVTFAIWPLFSTIFISYMASWIFTDTIFLFMIIKIYKKVKIKLLEQNNQVA